MNDIFASLSMLTFFGESLWRFHFWMGLGFYQLAFIDIGSIQYYGYRVNIVLSYLVPKYCKNT